jgi:heme A synthase
LLLVHQWTGYVVSVVVLVVALMAFGRAKDSREFDAGLYRAAFGLLALQVILGLILYGLDGYWEAAPLMAYVHPLLAIGALGIGQALLGRARKTKMAVDAHRLAGRGLILSFVLILAAIGVASAPA